MSGKESEPREIGRQKSVCEEGTCGAWECGSDRRRHEAKRTRDWVFRCFEGEGKKGIGFSVEGQELSAYGEHEGVKGLKRKG
jgi:hypothetical protein